MKASKAPSTGYCGIPALSISSLETSNGLLWMAARPTADNHNVWGVSTAWDRDTLAQDEIKIQLGIHSDAKAFVPQFYVASSGIRGVTAIAKRAAVGDWEYSPKSAEVVMNNILHLDKNTFAYLSGVPACLRILLVQVVRGHLCLLPMVAFCSRVMICITPLSPMPLILKRASTMCRSVTTLPHARCTKL